MHSSTTYQPLLFDHPTNQCTLSSPLVTHHLTIQYNGRPCLLEGKIDREHPKWKAYLRHKKTIAEYDLRRNIEKTEYVPFIEEVINSLAGLAARFLESNCNIYDEF